MYFLHSIGVGFQS